MDNKKSDGGKQTGGDVREAAESGEPDTSGRSKGAMVDGPDGSKDGQADESGRAGATPKPSKK